MDSLNSARCADAPPIRLSTPSLASRRMPRRSRVGHCGTLVAFDERRRIEHESNLEAKIATILMARRDVVDLREQLPPLSYVDAEGVTRSTRFDLLAELNDGSKLAVSVKPSQVAAKSGHEETLKLIARQTPRAFATSIKMMTERDAPDEAVYNARLILSVRYDPVSEAATVIATLAADLEGIVRIDRLGEASGLDDLGFRAIVRCIDRGILGVVDCGRIGPSTRVRRIGAR